METVKLRMLSKGPNKNYHKGQLVFVDALRAAMLIKGKHAEEVIHGNTGSLQERKDL